MSFRALILASAVKYTGHLDEKCSSLEQNMHDFFLLGTLRFGGMDLATAETFVGMVVREVSEMVEEFTLAEELENLLPEFFC